MKTILRTNSDTTTLVIKTGKITLRIGKNFDESRLRDLLRLTNELFESIINPEVDCYAHFTFEPTRACIALSSNPDEPNPGDLRYRRKW